MELVGYSLKRKNKKTNLDEYLITTGMFAGRWTLHFGVPCIADSMDCLDILKANITEETQIMTVNINVDLEYRPMGWTTRTPF